MTRLFHFYHALKHWAPARDSQQWVLATVYRVTGSAYRKPGSHMLLNDLGQQYGVVSGGCLEADLQNLANRVMQTGEARSVRYDSIDEDNIAFRKGLGCGGVVDIQLQPVQRENNYLSLDGLLQALEQHGTARYTQQLGGQPALTNSVEPLSREHRKYVNHCRIEDNGDSVTLNTTISAPPRLLIIGGGVDAIPLSSLALQLGWQVTVSDPRPANARAENFPPGCRIDRTLCQPDPGDQHEPVTATHWLQQIDAAVVMAHSQQIDAIALRQLCHSQLRYAALLGPRHRKQRVLAHAGIEETALPCTLQGPAGLDIGGELPESIALSILAQCHAALFGEQCRTAAR